VNDDFGRPWNSAEPSDSYRKWFPVFPDYSAFDIVGLDGEAIGLPKITTLGLKKKVLAAAIANKLGISLSYAEKRYVGESAISAPRDLGLSREIDDLFDQGPSQFCSYIDALKENFVKESELLDDLANQFFYRNIAGLDAAKKLSELGYLCEVAVILRSLIEQFAFAAKLRTLPVETELAKVKPVQCLNYLKSIEESAGRLYGLLSKYTHFEYDHHTHFFWAISGSNFYDSKGQRAASIFHAFNISNYVIDSKIHPFDGANTV
jgi:hypothetical protein